MFLPSGTMCNQVAIATHCRPGDEILAHEDAHIQSSEAGGPGAISRRHDPGAARDAGNLQRRYVTRSNPPGVTLFAAATTGGSRADREQRRRDLLASSGTSRRGRGLRTNTACRFTWTAPAAERGAWRWAWRRATRGRLRHGLAGLHQGLGGTAGCGPGGAERLYW